MIVTSSDPGGMPAILYGTAWKKDRTATLVQQAIEQGFRGIDTACQPKHYHEPGVGEGIAASLATGVRRADLYLQTKFTPLSGQDPARLPYDPASPLPAQVRQSFETSLHNLRTDYLDGLILHSPLPRTRDLQAVWQALESIADHGGARLLGISNCYDLEVLQALHQWARIKPAIVQNRFYAETGYDRALRAWCREQGVVYQSFWTLTANPQLLADPVITTLAKRYQRTPPQILFRYLVQEGVTPLTGTTSVQHMREDLAVLDFSLGGDECAGISRLLRINP